MRGVYLHCAPPLLATAIRPTVSALRTRKQRYDSAITDVMSIMDVSALSQNGRRYNVYKVRDATAIPDPDMPGPRYHTFIFVETEPDESGYIHQVTGDLVTGMRYESKRAERPEDSEAFHSKESIGTVLASSYPTGVDAVCRAQQPPGRQKAFNIKTHRTEPVKADGMFYQPGEYRKPLFKCTEWTEILAIPALKVAGVIESPTQTSASTQAG